MADNRVTEVEVKSLLDTELKTEDITIFLDTANRIVSNNCTSAYNEDTDAGKHTLHDLELWLAAHLVCIRDPQVSSEAIGDGKWTFDNKYVGLKGGGLNATRYGQQIMLIDSDSTLAHLSNSMGDIELEVLG